MMCLGCLGRYCFVIFLALSQFPLLLLECHLSINTNWQRKKYTENALIPSSPFDKLWYKNKPTTDLGGKRQASLPHPPLPASCVILSKICSSNQTFFLSSQAEVPWSFLTPKWTPIISVGCTTIFPMPSDWIPQNAPSIVSSSSLSNPRLQSIAPSC